MGGDIVLLRIFGFGFYMFLSQLTKFGRNHETFVDVCDIIVGFSQSGSRSKGESPKNVSTTLKNYWLLCNGRIVRYHHHVLTLF
jgi:hypothetical protein